MNQLVKFVSLFACGLALLTGQICYAQATAGQSNPYQNLGVYKIYNNNWEQPGTLPPDYTWQNENDWYGTQSAPAAFEKAQWGLDDVNSYRKSQGLEPLPETILKAEIRQPRLRLFRKR
jgi:hypothetical protein